MPTPEETADQVAKARLALEAAEAEHAAALTEGEANKPPEQLVHDLLEEIVMCLGNRPTMRALIKRFKASLEGGPIVAAPAMERPQRLPNESDADFERRLQKFWDDTRQPQQPPPPVIDPGPR